jgi:outer membrane receptor protein involved in Fe transport
MPAKRILPVAIAAALAGVAHAQSAERIGTIEVTGHYENAIGTSDAASQGTITRQLIGDRPLLRPAQVLEYVPGVIVTQHSGAGKANQYFLRGFNLDHGTDFSTWLAGMPVNLPTHAHGQGYMDLNFMIPELVARIDYFKGPYFAAIGDFSSAGGASIPYVTALSQGVAEATLGTFDYQRGLLAGSMALGPGTMLYGLELMHNDGPWQVPEDYRKLNGVLRYTWQVGEAEVSATAMGYSGKWNATDQIPRRAVDGGSLDRYGSLDASDGGESSRYSLSLDARAPLWGGEFATTAYAIDYHLNLWSNFTYFLTDPENGDQFEQADDRRVFGWTGAWTGSATVWGRPTRNTVGFQLRQDRIDPVGLYATRERERLSTTREDRVIQSSAGLYWENQTAWSEAFRTVVGLRGDRYRFDVTSDIPENSGTVDDGIVSPKLSMIFGPWASTEYFVNAGYGFHSNDARGVTIHVDPVTGEPVDPATPLVRAKGAELGARTEAIRNVQSSLALWYLTLDSELVFVGDAGTTEAGRPSRRYGLEWSTRWTPYPWLLFDLDVALTRARFSDGAPEGDDIPGAPPSVVAAGATITGYRGFSGALFMRYFGPRPLVESGDVKSGSSTLFDMQLGWQPAPRWKLRLDVFNLFDADVDDITYFYESRLPGEPAEGVADVHFHPAEKRSFRFTVSYAF